MLITYVTNSVGKVDDSKSGSPQFESYNKSSEKYRLVLLDKALYQRVFWMMNLLYLDYEYGMLKDQSHLCILKFKEYKFYHFF